MAEATRAPHLGTGNMLELSMLWETSFGVFEILWLKDNVVGGVSADDFLELGIPHAHYLAGVDLDDNSHLIRVEYERMERWKILKNSDGLVEKDHEDLD
ncbi:hypothetical protein BY996DRAFT_6510551 [Phakopsora pachyrhizi]|nr:hypothetical protein BY996DRAFT_6510551 [Phakopsora pachyrhizi]